MTKAELVRTLKEDLEVNKEIIALKVVKEPPPNIPQYNGQAIPGMCALLGELLREGGVYYVTKDNLGCFMSLLGTGTCQNLPRDKYLEFMTSQNEAYRLHKDAETVVKYYDSVDSFFKYPEVNGTGIVVGTLANVDAPDLVFLIVTPHQTDILNRCRAYLGDYSRGFGGSGSCIFNIRYSFVTGDPCFSASDTAWRVFGGLGRDELTYTFPYEKLMEIADQIKPTAEYINHLYSSLVS
jgi:uncharacterized protein (DUF169 family)